MRGRVREGELLTRLPDTTCAACGFTFTPRRRFQLTCSVECRNAHNARVSAAKRGDAMRGRKTTGGGKYPKLMGKPAHRAAAEALIGRALRPGEVVHHCNGDKDDWRPCNVIVMSSQAAHNRLAHGGWKDRLMQGRKVPKPKPRPQDGSA